MRTRNVLLISFLILHTNVSSAVECLAVHGVKYHSTPESVNKYSADVCRPISESSVPNNDNNLAESQQLKLYDRQEQEETLASVSLQPINIPTAIEQVYQARPVQPGYSKHHRKAHIFSEDINLVAGVFNIDPLLLHAIAYVESRYNPSAVSPAGAKGLMQVMPTTAQRFGFSGSDQELLNPSISLRVSSIYLRKLYDIFGNDLPLVLAAYNAGENAVIKYGRKIPPYRETQDYVKKVMAYYLSLKT